VDSNRRSDAAEEVNFHASWQYSALA